MSEYVCKDKFFPLNTPWANAEYLNTRSPLEMENTPVLFASKGDWLTKAVTVCIVKDPRFQYDRQEMSFSN